WPTTRSTRTAKSARVRVHQNTRRASQSRFKTVSWNPGVPLRPRARCVAWPWTYQVYPALPPLGTTTHAAVRPFRREPPRSEPTRLGKWGETSRAVAEPPRTSLMQTVVSLFEKPIEAQNAIHALEAQGIPRAAIGLALKHPGTTADP